jgi:hypothetical protein
MFSFLRSVLFCRVAHRNDDQFPFFVHQSLVRLQRDAAGIAEIAAMQRQQTADLARVLHIQYPGVLLRQLMRLSKRFVHCLVEQTVVDMSPLLPVVALNGLSQMANPPCVILTRRV